MTRLAQIDPKLATGELAQIYTEIEKTLGRVPNMARTMATQPIYLDIYMIMRAKLAEGRFDARTREAIATVVAADNGCRYCQAAHAAAATEVFGVPLEEVQSWQKGNASDPNLHQILTLARRLNATKGALDDADLDEARSAGLTDADIVEILGIVVMNIATNYFNRLAQTDIDFPTNTHAV